jgi:hypothetical protein
MRVRIKKSFAGYRIGQEFDWGDGMARIYLGRGMVEQVTGSASEPVTARPNTEEPKAPTRTKKATPK